VVRTAVMMRGTMVKTTTKRMIMRITAWEWAAVRTAVKMALRVVVRMALKATVRTAVRTAAATSPVHESYAMSPSRETCTCNVLLLESEGRALHG
jgi:hypothetical protein